MHILQLRGYGLVDAADEKVSNWMRYVNCANHQNEQNLVAFQYSGNIYYRTAKEIATGEELLVYYGNSFAEELGVDTVRYFEPKTEENKKVYVCDYCCLGFGEEQYKIKHSLRCRENPTKKAVHTGKLFCCSFCKVAIANKEFLNKHEVRCRSRKNLNSICSFFLLF